MPDVDGTPHHDPDSDCSLYARPAKKRMKPKFSPKPKERRLNTDSYKGLKAKVKPIVSGQDAFTDSVFAGTEPKVKGERIMADGSKRPNYDREIVLQLKTQCPGKWFAVDLETEDVWVSGEHFGKDKGQWYSADAKLLSALMELVVLKYRVVLREERARKETRGSRG